jgi:hypothetical protein
VLVGIVFLATAALVAFHPSLLPALHPSDLSGEMSRM